MRLVRVEMRDLHPNCSRDERDSAFRRMFATFKKAVTDAGILHDYKEHEHFESERRKKRKKKRESELKRLKLKLRENFPNRKSEKKSNKTSNKRKK
jgi:ribosomal protein S21